jgi:O-antigen ligase
MLLLLLPALFLIVLPFPGTVAARLLFLAVAFLIAAWQWWRQPEQRQAIPGKTVITLWAGVCLASWFYAVDPPYTLGEIKNEVGYTMMAFFAFFTLASDAGRARYLLRALALGFAVIGGWALTTWIAGGFVWDEGGRHGGIGVFSTYLVTVTPAFAWLALTEHSGWGRRLSLGLLLLVTILAIATAQRAVWPALTVEVLTFAYLLKRARSRPMKRRHWLVALSVVMSLALAGLLLSQAKRFGDAEMTATGISTDSRLHFWPGVVATIADHPLAGAGFGQRSMAKAYPDLIQESSQLWHAHNVFLNYGIGMGLPGMLAVAVLFGWWGWFFWRAATGSTALAGIAGLTLVAGVLMRNQFNDFFTRDMSLMFWALIAIFARLSVVVRPGVTR